MSTDPNKSQEAEENQPSGYIAKGLDPVGDVVGKGLSPVGKGVEQITKPVTDLVGGVTKPVLGPVAGSTEEKAEILGGDKKAEDFDKTASAEGKKSGKNPGFGGNDQTAQNPLGL